jgi:tetratricopeptide (TPR) repeat protein
MPRCTALFLIVLGFATPIISAQTKALDSLHNALKTAKEDTNKVRLLCKIVDELSYENLPKSVEYALQAKSLAQKLGNQALLATTLYQLGNTYYQSGVTGSAAELCMESLYLSQKIGDKALEAKALNRMGTIYRRQRDVHKAMSLLDNSQQIFRKLGDKRGISATFVNLGDCARILQQNSLALKYYSLA